MNVKSFSSVILQYVPFFIVPDNQHYSQNNSIGGLNWNLHPFKSVLHVGASVGNITLTGELILSWLQDR
jgi:hypothetical protein